MYKVICLDQSFLSLPYQDRAAGASPFAGAAMKSRASTILTCDRMALCRRGMPLCAAAAAAAAKHQVNKAVGEGVSHKRQLIDGSSPIYPLQLVASSKICLLYILQWFEKKNQKSPAYVVNCHFS